MNHTYIGLRPHANHPLGLILTCASLLALVSCGGAREAQQIDAGVDKSAFRLAMLPESFLEGGKCDSTELVVTNLGDKVRVDLHTTGAKGLKAVYLTLDYDPQALLPVECQNRELLSGSGHESLNLAVLDQPGRVYFGDVLVHPADQQGFSGSGTAASITFVPASGATANRTVSAPPYSDGSSARATINTSTGNLTWGYYSQGDYDQNSQTGISDLTPLAVHYQQEGPFGQNSIEAVVDGDSNGFITIADLTPIGVNLGSVVDGYNIYTSLNPDADYPTSNDAVSTIASLDTMAFSESTGNPVQQRRHYSYNVGTVASNQGFWVRPYQGSLEGTPSHLAEIEAAWTSNLVADGAGYSVSLGVVDGKPAIAYVGVSGKDVYFVIASDAAGDDWETPVPVTTQTNYVAEVDLAVINGKPAVAYVQSAEFSNDPNYIAYSQATDAQGTAWGVPVHVGTQAVFTHSPNLFELGGVPVIGATIEPSGDFSYHIGLYRAQDADGAAWSEWENVADTGFGSYVDFLIVDGNPAAFYYDEILDPNNEAAFYMVRATDAAGTAWAAAIDTMRTHFDEGPRQDGCVALINGFPAIATYNRPDQGPCFGRALDAQGSTWPEELLFLTSPFQNEDSCREVLIYSQGRPWIFDAETNETSFRDDLYYMNASDSDGEDWVRNGFDPPFTVVSNQDPIGSEIAAADVNGAPGVVYTTHSDPDHKLRYATYR